MTARASLNSFLATARAALTAPSARQAGPLTFVVGNESADLDSLCSAIVLAYLRTYSPPHRLHIPLSNLPGPDLALRPELNAVLRHAGLTASEVLTLSELPDLSPQDTRWILVDHNSLTGQLKKFSGQVIGCIDHHEDEQVVTQDVQTRVIEPCGSCMSLIVEDAKAVWQNLAQQDDKSEDSAAVDEKLARLALAPILIDTVNLTSKDKVKEKDTLAESFLQAQIRDRGFDNKKYFDEITCVKEDISDLNFRDIFRKDYKEWEEKSTKLGVCCAVQNFEYLLDKAGSADVFLEELSKWAAERDLDIAAVMTTAHPDGKFHRELLVWSMNDRGRQALEKFVTISDPLRLEKWRDGELDDGTSRRTWDQRELTASRKKVAPLLREAMRSV